MSEPSCGERKKRWCKNCVHILPNGNCPKAETINVLSLGNAGYVVGLVCRHYEERAEKCGALHPGITPQLSSCYKTEGHLGPHLGRLNARTTINWPNDFDFTPTADDVLLEQIRSAIVSRPEPKPKLSAMGWRDYEASRSHQVDFCRAPERKTYYAAWDKALDAVREKLPQSPNPGTVVVLHEGPISLAALNKILDECK